MTNVLIADNDRDVSSLLVELLRRAGLRATPAYDGPSAARLARDPALRVLVCDLDMPGASGLEVLESLCDLRRPPAVMVISGYLDDRIRTRLAALPFVHAVLGKPFDLMRFQAMVKDLAGTVGGQGGEFGVANGEG
ncbi:MAG: response regulator [Planctomycetes bacterium]|nr:response regulator [Planctomycetota bacterium]